MRVGEKGEGAKATAVLGKAVGGAGAAAVEGRLGVAAPSGSGAYAACGRHSCNSVSVVAWEGGVNFGCKGWGGDAGWVQGCELEEGGEGTGATAVGVQHLKGQGANAACGL